MILPNSGVAKKNWWLLFVDIQPDSTNIKNDPRTVLPAKSDSDVRFCFKSYQGLIIDISLV